jgi:iron complex transport system permease protein
MIQNRKSLYTGLAASLLLVLLLAIAFGAVPITLSDMWSGLVHALRGEKPGSLEEAVFVNIRLPRVLLCAVTGAILASSGVLMQALFRNPIVEPGLIGTSAGSAFGASFVFVMAGAISPSFKSAMGPMLTPLFAFGGGLLATWLVYKLAAKKGSVAVVSLLLVGVAVNAIALSGTGFLSYIARDPQARSITFWSLGTFSGANWDQFAITSIVAVLVWLYVRRYARQLNTLILGEEESVFLGADPEKLKVHIMILNTAMVSVATAFVGVISFIGLIVPHMLRLLVGSDNRKLLPASVLAGALVLTMADMAARLLAAPAEIPIGIITSLVGAPVFILMLRGSSLFGGKGGYYD